MMAPFCGDYYYSMPAVPALPTLIGSTFSGGKAYLDYSYNAKLKAISTSALLAEAEMEDRAEDEQGGADNGETG